MKPYGKSFDKNPTGANSANPKDDNSLWYFDPPSLTDKLLNYIGGLTKFSQANATALADGNVKVVCASLYPLEKWFVNNKLGTGLISDLLDDFALGIGENRINFIQVIQDYFSDLECEYSFYKQLHGAVINSGGAATRYVIAKNYNDIEGYLAQDSINQTNTVCFVLTIEGMHVLNTGLGKEPDEMTVLSNLDKIKNWEFCPFFVTVAHHFWNNLCGHARSLTGIVGQEADQSDHLGAGFTELGFKVVDRLLDRSQGKRILIDIKHMSAVARQQYLQKLNTDHKNEGIPIIMSHAAANGYRSLNEPVIDITETGNLLLHEDINFYDEEILAMAKSGGIMGLQLDERRIASPETLHNTPHSLFRNKIMHYRSQLLWNQVQHIAELLNNNGMFAWDNIAIGSDFDGIIDPLNSFWTEKEMPYLADYLERHAFNYMQGRGKTALSAQNQLSAHEVITRIFSDNAMRFMKKYFI
jgi:microsomal dipeptidase-like Zn-dependent dipeptidase